MKRLIVLFLLALALGGNARAQSFSEEFAKVRKSDDPTAVQKFLQDTKEREKDNPDYYVAVANYWWGLAQGVDISTKPAAKGDFALVNKETGKAAGSIGKAGNSNPELSRNAIDALKEGLRRFPTRIDIGIGLAYMQKEENDPDACLKTFEEVLAVIAKDPDAVRWKNNEGLPGKPDKFIPESLYSYTTWFYKAESKEGDARCEKLCERLIAVFPNHPYAYNIMAALRNAQGNEKESLRYFLLAREKAPDDPIILLNLGRVYADSGEKAKAREAYSAVLKLKNLDPELRDAAQQVIKELGGGKSTGKSANP